MANARDYPPDFEPGPSSAEALNQLPRGRIGQGERSSNLTGVDTQEGQTLIGYDITVPAGRRLEFRGGATVQSNIAGGAHLRIEINDVQIQRKNEAALGGGLGVSWELTKDKELDAGTYSVKLILGISGAGSNVVSAIANGESDTYGVMFLYVTDVGPAFGDL